ncbi:unnamed protein product [Polarella glacialis]|uniref:Cyclin-like domain-containing protein n=1 Tax=Polarella glacialis TaxID=89957 RepID=A0A813JBP3_POLGL|nr:unnamed protein product [Polarella glacialis]
MSGKCPYCGCTDLINSAARGDTVCGNPACGELLAEQTMVTETSFVTTSSGGVAASGGRVVFHAGMSFAGGAPSSQELAINRGITKIGFIADRLQLSAQIQEAGRRMYQLAVQMNFNAGRPTRYVASACLYVVCRRNRSPHMLIDFSDVLQTPVKTIGACYMRLMRRLVGGDPAYPPAMGTGAIEVPMVDPSIFIERFARKLSLGGMQRKVQNTAMRLIQYMHRDWICIGRRPNGLCGAALLIASYYHGLRCSAKDIADTVRISEGTLRNRLTEMKDTPLALMSREQFEKANPDAVPSALEDQGQLALPPCMIKRNRREIREQQAAEHAALVDAEQTAALGDAPSTSFSSSPGKRAAGDLALQDASPAASKRRAGRGKRTLLPEVEESSQQSATQAEESSQQSSDARYTAREPSADDIEHIAKDIASYHGIEAVLEGRVDPVAEQRVDKLVAGKPDFGEAKEQAPKPEVADGPGGVESLSDVEDEELEMYLLDSEETQHKSDIWHEVNKDYLEEWHIRGLESKRRKQGQQEQADFEASCGQSDAGSERSHRGKLPPASSCTASAMMALAKKGKMGRNRINLEALDSLFS